MTRVLCVIGELTAKGPRHLSEPDVRVQCKQEGTAAVRTGQRDVILFLEDGEAVGTGELDAIKKEGSETRTLGSR